MERRENAPQKQAVSDAAPRLIQKLTPPISLSSQVQRTEVDAQLQASNNAKLILIRAPAGFGKTTVMAQYRVHLQRHDIVNAWLRLDAADNDVGRFVAYLAAALNKVDPAFELMAAGDADVDNFALDLINRICMTSSRLVLFMDEFETIQSQTVLALVRQILQHVPEHVKVVIGSRDIPDVGLGRLRMHGHLLEIGPSALRFSVVETACLFRDKRNLALADDDIARLQRCTEGWVAALQLAALSLAGRKDYKSFVSSFSGSNADIADYLAEDVLAGQSPEVRSFLLKTSILEQLGASLCDAVTDRGNSGAMLAQLERANLFLISLDDERRWYRYHSVFADFLRTQLEQAMPAEIPNLHRRAAEWYAAHDRPVPAIDHALASGKLDFALALLDQHAENLLYEGRVRLLARWLDALPVQSIEQSPKLRLVHAWALSLTLRYKEATQVLESLSCSTANLKSKADMDARVMALQAFIFAMTDRSEQCCSLCMQDLEKLSSLDPFTYGVMANALAYGLIGGNRYREARDILDEAKRSHQQLGVTFSMAITECSEGMIDLLQGHLCSATARLRNAFSGARASGRGSIGGRATAGVWLAVALYEANEIEEAKPLLDECLPFIKETGTPDALIASHLVLIRIALIENDRTSALQLMSDLEHLGHRSNLPRVVATAWLERCRLATLEGNKIAAWEYLRAADDKEVWLRYERFSMHANDIDTLAIARARLLIRQGEPEDAIPHLQQQISMAEITRRYRRVLKLKILLAEALHASGQVQAAIHFLLDALRFAHVEGFVRSFADEGPTIGRLVREIHKTCSDEKNAGSSLLLGFLDRIIQATPQVDRGSSAPKRAATQAAEHALTDREMEVLHLLADGHPNRVLAERLRVSETTIKSHLRNITAKLAARNRTDAVGIAKRLGII
jgi:LuxR family maltose regulon positive regulatory protein